MTGSKPTLIITRRRLAEVNAALAGITLVAPFARFKASMAMSNEGRVPSLPRGRWYFSVMIEILDIWGKSGVARGRWGIRSLIETSVHLFVARLGQTDPSGEGNY